MNDAAFKYTGAKHFVINILYMTSSDDFTTPYIPSLPLYEYTTRRSQLILLQCQDNRSQLSLLHYFLRYSKISIDFLHYRNPSNHKATGIECDVDEDGSLCDIYIEVCISPIGSRLVAVLHI
jgi:hypothetical protein